MKRLSVALRYVGRRGSASAVPMRSGAPCC